MFLLDFVLESWHMTLNMLHKVAFTMYPVDDPERARAFYEDKLGLERGSSAPNGDWTEYDLPGGGCLALMRGSLSGAKPSAGHGSIAFEVDDLEATNARLKQQGVAYLADMIHSPVCRMSVILDSEGNSIILHQLAPKG
jgi:predicted enzyme related to lactoylglutathione lyase